MPPEALSHSSGHPRCAWAAPTAWWCLEYLLLPSPLPWVASVGALDSGCFSALTQCPVAPVKWGVQATLVQLHKICLSHSVGMFRAPLPGKFAGVGKRLSSCPTRPQPLCTNGQSFLLTEVLYLSCLPWKGVWVGWLHQVFLLLLRASFAMPVEARLDKECRKQRLLSVC